MKSVQKSKKCDFFLINGTDFFYCERTSDLKNVLTYDRKIAARRFGTISDIQLSLTLAQSLLEDRNAPLWRMDNQGVKIQVSS